MLVQIQLLRLPKGAVVRSAYSRHNLNNRWVAGRPQFSVAKQVDQVGVPGLSVKPPLLSVYFINSHIGLIFRKFDSYVTEQM